jgi:cytochrome c biogenesis protein CcdA
MFAVLSLGFLLGMQHALEADHIAAVSSIAARRSDISDIVKHGLTWGLGHTLTLFAFAGFAILLGHAIPDSVARPIETAVGVMLIGLGTHVLWRLWRDRVHFHAHSHGDGARHIHLHSHAGETTAHAASAHTHVHGFRWRTLLVGLMHGMAGSAALLVLAVSQAASPATAVAYVLLFGIGSMLGMGALSAVIAVPLAVSARWLTWTNRALQGAVGVVTIAVGVMTIHAAGFGSARAQDAAPPPDAAVSGTAGGVVPSPAKAPRKIRAMSVRGDGDSAAALQRAVLFEEAAGDPRGTQTAGTVVWRTEAIKDPTGPGIGTAVRADVWIPARNLGMTLSFRRNTDTSLPASHAVDLTFILPVDFAGGGGIANVPGILMKTAERGSGTPLGSIAVKVSDGVFLVGLSNVEADRVKNLELMRTRPWFEVPLVYADKRVGLLAIDKGAPGERAFAAAFAAWEQASAPAPRTQEALAPAASEPPTGGYLVQVASKRSEADAQAAYKALQAKFPAVLGPRSPFITRTDLGDKGVYYRVTIGPFETSDAAAQVCGDLKTAGGQCVVQKN